MTAHKSLGESQLHEPKGVSTATTGAVATANGGAVMWKLPCYGEMAISNSSATFTPIAADIDQYKHLVNIGWGDGIASASVTVNADNTLDNIVLDVAGDYLANFWCSFETSAATGTKFAVKYAIDGTPVTRKIKVQKNSSGADVLVLSAQGIVAVAANQALSVYMSSSAATTLSITDAGFSVQRLK